MTSKGSARRQTLIDATAEIIRESGPSAVTHRGVAQRAGCSLSATTYYFAGMDELLYEAGLVNIGLWSERAEHVADKVESLTAAPDMDETVELLLAATLPAEGPYLGHYVQLLLANESAPVGRAYREGRQRLNAAVDRVVHGLGVPLTPEMVIAVVDGSAVTALSERRDVRLTAATMLRRLIYQASMLQKPAGPHEPENLRSHIAQTMPLPSIPEEEDAPVPRMDTV